MWRWADVVPEQCFTSVVTIDSVYAVQVIVDRMLLFLRSNPDEHLRRELVGVAFCLSLLIGTLHKLQYHDETICTAFPNAPCSSGVEDCELGREICSFTTVVCDNNDWGAHTLKSACQQSCLHVEPSTQQPPLLTQVLELGGAQADPQLANNLMCLIAEQVFAVLMFVVLHTPNTHVITPTMPDWCRHAVSFSPTCQSADLQQSAARILFQRLQKPKLPELLLQVGAL
jgi:hypothetical protein